jgi:hypothetical protein
LEVVGALGGTLEVPSPVRVVNISLTGALIESPLAVPLESTQLMHFDVDGEHVPVQALVRHVRHATGRKTQEYLVGVEFVSPPAALLHSIERLAPDPGSAV